MVSFRYLASGLFGIGLAALAGAAVLGQAPAPDPVVVPESAEQVRLSFAPVVSRVAPSVVNVYATRIEQSVVSPFAGDPFFERFFGGNSPFFQSRPRQSQSLGSGVIVDGDGLILTNSHVVTGASDIRIALADRREYPVDLVLDDPATDLAVLRLREGTSIDLPAIEFADSDRLAVGDLVLAIGNPFGVGQTVTSGIVSALARTGVEASDFAFFIQTDAAINPGNSGGALVDLDGRLVGINTAIYSRSGGSVGIGFAIPANMAQVVVRAGREGGTIVRPWLGARLQIVNTDIAASIGLAAPIGAMITEVAPGGPAERAGLRSGDVILAMDGVSIEDPAAFSFRLATRTPGDEARLTLLRAGERLETVLAIEAPQGAGEDRTARISGNTRFAGVTAEELTPAVAEAAGLGYDARGMIVTALEPGSPAAAMGLAVGDVILALNGVEMGQARLFGDMASQRARSWEIVLYRDGRTMRSIVSG